MPGVGQGDQKRNRVGAVSWNFKYPEVFGGMLEGRRVAIKVGVEHHVGLFKIRVGADEEIHLPVRGPIFRNTKKRTGFWAGQGRKRQKEAKQCNKFHIFLLLGREGDGYGLAHGGANLGEVRARGIEQSLIAVDLGLDGGDLGRVRGIAKSGGQASDLGHVEINGVVEGFGLFLVL